MLRDFVIVSTPLSILHDWLFILLRLSIIHRFTLCPSVKPMGMVSEISASRLPAVSPACPSPHTRYGPITLKPYVQLHLHSKMITKISKLFVFLPKPQINGGFFFIALS